MRIRHLAAATLALMSVPALAQIATTPQQPGQPIASRVPAGTYQVDPAHTQVSWQVNHMGFSMLEGQFGASGGSITIDPKKPAATKVDISFNVDDLSVTSAGFAKHLKSEDFFNAAQYPTARFVSTRIVPKGANSATMTGNLTIKDQTKPVTLDVTLNNGGDHPMKKVPAIGFDATTTLKRSDFGVGAYAPVVSDTVNLTIHAAFTA